MKYYSGNGLINSAINKLPFELHIPGYNFCGPGTKLQKRLGRGDTGVNGLDNSCKKHDIQYSMNKDLRLRHEADELLAKEALKRVRSKDASVGERLAALGVAGLMKAKVKLGMGLNSHNQNIKKSNRLLQRIKSNINKILQDVENINVILKSNKIKNSSSSSCIKSKTTATTTTRSNKKLKQSSTKRPKKTKKNIIDLDEIENNENIPEFYRRKNKLKNTLLNKLSSSKAAKKRKNFDIDEDNDDTDGNVILKKPKVDLNEPITYPMDIDEESRKRKRDEYDSDNDDYNKKLRLS